MRVRNFILGLCSVLGTAVHAQYTIPDPQFVFELEQIIPDAMSGNVLDTNHVDVTSLTVLTVNNSGIYDLSGVQFFSSLDSLNCCNNHLTILPALPASLKRLYCWNNDLTSLPPLPLSLLELKCHINELTSLPLLPGSLTLLDCNSNQLTSLPSLPASLQRLDCWSNDLASLPALPASLLELRCHVNYLTSLPALTASMTLLHCSANQLTSLPPLPASLGELYCNYNALTSLPPLPSSLGKFWCDLNQLTSLPPLPASLWYLDCSSNPLTGLPPLPASLQFLVCQTSQLTSLPSLPASLLILNCQNNELTGLPSLPNSLNKLYCQNNELTILPSLPASLLDLVCFNNQLSCLPGLPDSLDILKCQGNAITCLPNFPVQLPPFGTQLSDSNIGFDPVLCLTDGSCFPAEVIAGTIFIDSNGNGLKEPGEGPLSFTSVEAQPGNYLGGGYYNGNYALPVEPGSYTLQGQPVLYHAITTPVHAVTITADMSDTANHIGYVPIPGIHDLVVDIECGVTRPGFYNQVWLEVKNIGTEPTTATIDFDFDVDQNFVSSSITPASQSGTNVDWSVAMNPGDVWSATVTLYAPATDTLGTPIDHLFVAIPVSADTTPSNNTTTWNDVVVGSYDPNDKTASASALTPAQVQNGEYIEYVIRFQNTGTFMAEHVRITDTLSADLLRGSFEYISSSHDNYWYLSNGTLVFQFDHIQLPDSNANEPGSHGFVKFRIKADPNLSLGDQIVNVANIYFDFNAPVITEPSVVLIDEFIGIQDAVANAVRIHPNPTAGVLNIVSDHVIETFRLYSSDGRLLRSGTVNAASHRMDVSGFEGGVYLLDFGTANGRSLQRLVIEE